MGDAVREERLDPGPPGEDLDGADPARRGIAIARGGDVGRITSLDERCRVCRGRASAATARRTAATCSARRRRRRSTTIRLPAISGRAATSSAAWNAAPAEIPTSSPSRLAAERAPSRAHPRRRRRSPRRSRRGRAPRDEAGADALDLVRAGRAAGEHRRGAGSTAITCIAGRRSFSTWPTPVIVPPVPTPQTSASTSPPSVAPDLLGGRPPVDLGIGGVVELLRHERLRARRRSRSASSIASPMPPSDGVSRTSAP